MQASDAGDKKRLIDDAAKYLRGTSRPEPGDVSSIWTLARKLDPEAQPPARSLHGDDLPDAER